MLSLNIHLLRNFLFLFIFSCAYISPLLAGDSTTIPKQKKEKQQLKNELANATSGFIFYGNWCGPNHPKDISKAPNPIDLLDSQCKTHDLCYSEKGDFDCGCDRAMVKELDNSQKMKQFDREQYLLAQNIKLHFAFSPCNGEVNGNKVLPTRVLTRIYKGTKNHVLNTYDRFIGNRFPSMKRNDDSQKEYVETNDLEPSETNSE